MTSISIAEWLLIATAVLCLFFLLYALYQCFQRMNIGQSVDSSATARRPSVSVISDTTPRASRRPEPYDASLHSPHPPPYEPPPVFPDEPPPSYVSLAREERRHQRRLRIAPTRPIDGSSVA